jgi:dipeptidyl aminopeptidase/acylaminoacyl peptidase
LNKGKVIPLVVSVLSCLTFAIPPLSWAEQAERPFTIADDIQLAVFGGSSGLDKELVFSPDGNYFVVETERGRPDLNRPEDSLRFYRCQDVLAFLQRSDGSQVPSPMWVVNRSTDKEGPILKGWRWLPDSSGLAFLERTSGDNYRLTLADLRKKRIERLTSEEVAVEHFDVRDRQHYVYTGTNVVEREKLQAERQAPAIVGTGRPLVELLTGNATQSGNRNFYLWAVVGGKCFEVSQDGIPVIPDPDRELAVSPDGRSVIAALPVPRVPASWETLYPPLFASDAYRIRAGHNSAHQWVRIDLQANSIQALTDAPESPTGTWARVFNSPRWSSDGQAVLLPGTFLKSKENAPSRPCVAVVDLALNARACVEILKGRTETGVEEGFHDIQEVRFASGDKKRVIVGFREQDESFRCTEYQQADDDTWQVVRQTKSAPEVEHNGLKIAVKQGLNEPPLLIGTDKQKSRVIWDPNPQLKNVELGSATVYEWKDKQGRDWRGGLYKPSTYKAGQRYPLVIQTHGFTSARFLPSGIFPTAFAARALATAGIVVLQVEDEKPCLTVTPREGPCAVAGYEAAVDQLVFEGLVDPERIGIIGFSRTCFYVMEALTNSSLHLKAASITDGVMVDYLQYLVGLEFDWMRDEYDAMIGAEPFGKGLEQWLKRSPGFNLDKINTPLMVISEGPVRVLHMWQPYAGLRYLHKPVDLMVLNTGEHVLTNPAVRLASQGGSVDWFRFWLQDYEDPDPAKVKQYARWNVLRKLHRESDMRK